ncbi:MAG TPA: nucleotidyltransferase domain-containing protein [Candidatus Kapabacteria bacterium]|nr:nucleotidyltransferase domain-containing protein [Candidatus Kapabacteria bacterium]
MSVVSEKYASDQSQTGNKAVHVIREIFSGKNLKIEKIIFFGSLARGDYKNDSDWDFLGEARKSGSPADHYAPVGIILVFLLIYSSIRLIKEGTDRKNTA